MLSSQKAAFILEALCDIKIELSMIEVAEFMTLHCHGAALLVECTYKVQGNVLALHEVSQHHGYLITRRPAVLNITPI